MANSSNGAATFLVTYCSVSEQTEGSRANWRGGGGWGFSLSTRRSTCRPGSFLIPEGSSRLRQTPGCWTTVPPLGTLSEDNFYIHDAHYIILCLSLHNIVSFP